MSAPQQQTVCYVARLDFVAKPGGDTVQWQMYDRTAQAAGWRTMTWFGDEPMPVADLYHAFNIDRPLELYPKLRAVRRAGRPFVLSTIHHPNDWLEKFRLVHPPSGRMGQLLYRSPFGRSVAASESIKEIARLVQQRRITRLLDVVPSWSARVRWLLEEASFITLLSRKEADFLQLDFGFRAPPGTDVVVPNWVEGIAAAHGDVAEDLIAQARDAVLLVGRIEARKNNLNLARILEEAGQKSVFIGRVNPNEPAYTAEFSRTIEPYRHVRWITGVPRQTLAAFYGVGKMLLNGSYVEVSPLVDIEALSCGCPVATTRYALHHELLPKETPVVDPYETASLHRALAAPTARVGPRVVIDPHEAKRALLRVYADALNRR